MWLETAGIQNVIALLSGSELIGKWRRVVQRLALDAVVVLQSFRDCFRISKNLPGFRYEAFIAMFDPFADAGAFRIT